MSAGRLRKPNGGFSCRTESDGIFWENNGKPMENIWKDWRVMIVMKTLENAAVCTELNSCHSQVLSRKHSASHPSAREHSLAEHVLAVLAVLTAKSMWSCVCIIYRIPGSCSQTEHEQGHTGQKLKRWVHHHALSHPTWIQQGSQIWNTCQNCTSWDGSSCLS
jgi:hypothetical protein